MEGFRKILFLYQGRVGDEATLDRAIALARSNSAALTLATAVGPPRAPVLGFFSPPPSTARARCASLVDETQRHLRRLAAGIGPRNFPIRCKALVGRPDEKVLQLVRSERIDLLMMTADHESVLGPMAFGRQVVRLMRNAPCSVWVCPPCRIRKGSNIVAAVDLEGPDAVPSPLDIQILQIAAALARQRSGHLDILHAWDLRGDDLATSRTEITDEIRKRLLHRGSSVAARAVARLCNMVDLDALQIEVHLPRGKPLTEITHFASYRPVDVIVMGIVRTGLAALLFGNTAEDVLQQVSAPVLTIKERILPRAQKHAEPPQQMRSADPQGQSLARP